GRTALLRNLQHRGVEPPAADSLTALIQQSAESLIVRLEQKMSLKPRPRDSLVERIRRARRAIHDVRLDESRAQDHAAAVHWADEAMLALRIASYGGDYIESHPTIDRIAETIEKLSEDIYGRTCPPTATRHAFVHFCPPIDLDAYRESFARKARIAVRALTAACEQSVQEALDRLNAANPHTGGKLWTEAPAAPHHAAGVHDRNKLELRE
ncbi:MAG: hypothetical protein IID33_14470, partial [Planctomycetes bacterium]|nr:hypothetical protein [Planctomycetota bacterium]